MLLVGDYSHGYNRKVYTGYTHRLMQRLIQHSGLSNTKGARMTRKQQIELVYLEKFFSRKKALQREREYKKKSPFNQKKYKIKLIKEFQSNYGSFLERLNKQLAEHHQLMNDLTKTVNYLESNLPIIINNEHEKSSEI